jgi:hypothetical protein
MKYFYKVFIKTKTTMELISGAIAGLSAQLLCHPIDTIKTRLQNNSNYNISKDIQKNNFRTLYKGLPSPLVSVIIEKSLLFWSYDLIKNDKRSPFFSGILAGIVTTFTVTPFEYIKVNTQLSKKDSMRVLRNSISMRGFSSLYRGWSAVFIREVPGYGLYFGVYEKMKKDNMSVKYSFLTGASCGATAWLFIYPSDAIKTDMQYKNIGIRESTYRIYNSHGIKGFYNGFTWGVVRASIFHGTVFIGYEMSKKMFHL